MKVIKKWGFILLAVTYILTGLADLVDPVRDILMNSNVRLFMNLVHIAIGALILVDR